MDLQRKFVMDKNYLERQFGREYRHGMWRTVYQEQRKINSVWMNVFMLGALLLAMACVMIPIAAVYGK